MKLDRNENKDGRGKYALLNLRKLHEIEHGSRMDANRRTDIHNAVIHLRNAGLLHYGNEGPDEQFFVMKYKDKFTAPALRAYAEAVLNHIRGLFHPGISAKILSGEALTKEECELREQTIKTIRTLNPYWDDICNEASMAQRAGNRIPD
jgi:hypothetical protein